MNFSAVDFNPYQGTDKSPSNEIKSGQSLQSFLADSVIASSSRGDFDKVSIVSMPLLRQHGRSQPPQAQQLSLLVPLEKPQKPGLYIEQIPEILTVGFEQRFWLVHRPSSLKLPGQFSYQEAEYLLKTTERWNWAIEYKPRTPNCNCNHRLLNLLITVCTPQKTLECAA